MTIRKAPKTTKPGQSVDFTKEKLVSSDLIQSLRPKDGSAAAISDSIRALTAKRLELEANIPRLDEERGCLLVGDGTDADLMANEKAIQANRLSIERIDATIPMLRTKLTEAKATEHVQGLLDKLAALGLEEANAAFAEFWNFEYEVHARAIAQGLELERLAADAHDKAFRIWTQLKEAGYEMPAPQLPVVAAIGGKITGARRLGELVRLPGMLGAPRVPTEYYNVDVSVTCYEPDPTGGYDTGPDGNSWGPKRRKVEKTQSEQRVRASRDDMPVWPPHVRDWNDR
jgi:hypothetical protein